MAFQGSLAELPLPDIIQLVSVSGKTGRFTLTWDDRAGQIYLRNGQIVHASLNRRPEVSGDGEDGLVGDETSGEEAIYELATWSEGDFVFNPGEESASQTIDKPNTNLLMEAARRMDEWQVLRKKIHSTSLVPRRGSQSSSAGVSFTAREWSLVQQIDGRRSIDDLAVLLGESAFSTSKDLYGLLTSGQVELSEPWTADQVRAANRLTPQAADRAVDALEAAAAELLASPELPPGLRRSAKLARAQLRSGRICDALTDLVHTHEAALVQHGAAESVKEYRRRVNTALEID